MTTDTEILFPNRAVAIGGEEIIVREFSFQEELQASALAGPLIRDMDMLFGGEGEVSLMPAMACFGRHAGLTCQLIALATGRSPEWVGGLARRDGQALLMAFWGVNLSFFIDALGLLMAERQMAVENSPENSLSGSGSTDERIETERATAAP
jgi:hypothetical protein